MSERIQTFSHDQLSTVFQRENDKFKEYYLWLESAMPSLFFEELGLPNVLITVHNLMELDVQEYVSSIHLKNMAIVICLDAPDADLEVLKNYAQSSISSYQAYVSLTAPPFLQTKEKLRIIVIHFSAIGNGSTQPPLNHEEKEQLHSFMKLHHPEIKDKDFEDAIEGMTPTLVRSLTQERMAIAIKMYIRATTRDHCQYEVAYLEDWETKKIPSMQLTFAWRNTPKHHFLYRLMRTISRHHLTPKWVSASYKDPYKTNSILVMAIDLHGIEAKPAWEATNIVNFIRDIITVKYFASFDLIDQSLVQKGVIAGNMGNLLRAMTNFIHQALVHLDVNLYTLEHVEEGLCRHPELAEQLCSAFTHRFDPNLHNLDTYRQIREKFLISVNKLDTGHVEHDIRRKNILLQGMNFIHHVLKTNFYRPNYSSLSFRLDPTYLDHIPFDRTKKFPELPYAVFFIKGMHFFGFHIRFKDLARGGLRTVYPEHTERMLIERNTVFTECYNLALTQQMKNKDIPEGGAKGIIFLKPAERVESETAVLRTELQASKKTPEEIESIIDTFRQEQKLEHLYQAQRSFIESLITIVNCEPDGKLRPRYIVDYWGKPEYLYLGPDENMHDEMIEWIAHYSKKMNYKPGSAFISGKPKLGINHKQYGVTSLGVNVYVDTILRYMGIDPTKDSFTVKMAGGPDGDVAGNEICNLYRFYTNTAKLIALTDISGTVHDPLGLDLSILVNLFHQGRSIRFYPPQKLNNGSFLIDKMTKRYQTSLMQQTLCWRKDKGKLEQEWLTGSEMNHLMRSNVHSTHADLFIPAGGRPRTLNASNYEEFLDETGKPTARAVVEGANLYFDNVARRALEERGVLMIKDSSANKTGVICSSFEVLSGLTLGDQKFLEYKQVLVDEISERLRQCAVNEANLLVNTHKETKAFLTDISDLISKRINVFTDQLLNYLEPVVLSDNPKDPLIRCFLDYCLPVLRNQFHMELLTEIPDSHKKAIIACHIAAQMVYERGLDWSPSIVDILPVILGRR